MNKSHRKSGFLSVGVKYALIAMLAIMCVITSKSYQTAAEEEWVHYYGIVTGNLVNVRSGPGTKYDKIIDDKGNAVQLEGQQQVIILDEALADDANLWYKISFEKNGNTYEGFSSGSFIAKDESKGTITPSPLPTPTEEPSVTPTPVDIATSTPRPTTSLIKTEENTGEGNSASTIKSVIIAVVIIAVLFMACFVFMSFRQKKVSRNKVHSSRKVDRIKRVSEQESGNVGSQNKRRPEIRRSDEDEAYSTPAKREVYYTNEITDEEDILASLGAPTDSKRALRSAIDRLQEHDIITHSIYGEGEVYDNSDVKLIEVRFGNDVRFLNKDSIVNKGLVTIVDEEEQAVAKRRRRKRRE